MGIGQRWFARVCHGASIWVISSQPIGDPDHATTIHEGKTEMKSEAIDKTIVVDGVEVSYRTSGPVNDRLPLVLVHGTAGNIDSHFGFLFPMMAFRQRVIGINLAEPNTDAIALEQFAAQVSAVINAEVPDGSVTLLGYSMGAPIAAKT